MALITCKECGAQISDQSEKCIKCGAPTINSIEKISEEVSNQSEEIPSGVVINQSNILKNDSIVRPGGKKIVIGLVIVVFVVAIVSILFLNSDNYTNSLSPEEVLAVGSVQELMGNSNNPDAITLKKVEVAKCDDEGVEAGWGDYIVRIIYDADNGNIGIKNSDTGEWYTYVSVQLGDNIGYSINSDIQATLVMSFGLYDSVSVDINLINEVLENLSKYDFNQNDLLKKDDNKAQSNETLSSQEAEDIARSNSNTLPTSNGDLYTYTSHEEFIKMINSFINQDGGSPYTLDSESDEPYYDEFLGRYSYNITYKASSADGYFNSELMLSEDENGDLVDIQVMDNVYNDITQVGSDYRTSVENALKTAYADLAMCNGCQNQQEATNFGNSLFDYSEYKVNEYGTPEIYLECGDIYMVGLITEGGKDFTFNGTSYWISNAANFD